MLRGVVRVQSGYGSSTSPQAQAPTYEQVSTGKTGFAEVVKIDFNETEISFTDLLTVFFYAHDPTQLNRQGADIGTQYRSVIFYADELQKAEADAYSTELQNDGVDVVTTLEPLTAFYPAEEYHHNYYARNTNKPYCTLVIAPKIEKVEKRFAQLLNT